MNVKKSYLLTIWRLLCYEAVEICLDFFSTLFLKSALHQKRHESIYRRMWMLLWQKKCWSASINIIAGQHACTYNRNQWLKPTKVLSNRNRTKAGTRELSLVFCTIWPTEFSAYVYYQPKLNTLITIRQRVNDVCPDIS